MRAGDESNGRAHVRVARLTGDSPGGARRPVPPDPVAHVKDEMLWKAVMDEPWDTSLAWADAAMDLTSLDPADLDRIVRTALLQALDEGLAFFFEVTGFGESYSRDPVEDELLSREALLRVLGEGSDGPEGGNSISAPVLGIRATERGREHVFARWPEDRIRWERFNRR